MVKQTLRFLSAHYRFSILSSRVSRETPLLISSSSDVKDLNKDDGDNNVSVGSILSKSGAVFSQSLAHIDRRCL